jgi:hypothetical protein
MRRAAAIVAALVGAFALVGAGQASAASLVVTPAAPKRGTSVTVTATGLTARGSVSVTIGSLRRSARATSSGRITLSMKLPARWRPGTRTLTLRSGSRRVSAALSVRSKAGAPALLASLSSGERFVLNPTGALAGASVTVKGTRLSARTRVKVAIGGRSVGSSRASAKGSYRLAGAVPSVTPGRDTLTLRGGRVKLSVPFSVLAAAAGPAAPGTATPGGPVPSGSVVVAAAGDVACDPAHGGYGNGDGVPGAFGNSKCRARATAAVVDQIAPSAVLVLGDLETQGPAAVSEMRQTYGDPLGWGRLDPIAYPAVGDHELDKSATAQPYFDYWGAKAGSAGGYYSVNIGAWHIISLNSNCGSGDALCKVGSAQEAWLRADLAAHPARCTLAFWHKPRYTSGQAGAEYATTPLVQALVQGGAELMLGGHDQNYERFAPQTAPPSAVIDRARGIRQIVVGTGGEQHQAFATGTTYQPAPAPPGTIVPFSASEAGNDATFGVLKLTLAPTSYAWQFIPAAGEPTFTDSGADVCH